MCDTHILSTATACVYPFLKDRSFRRPLIRLNDLACHPPGQYKTDIDNFFSHFALINLKAKINLPPLTHDFRCHRRNLHNSTFKNMKYCHFYLYSTIFKKNPIALFFTKNVYCIL